jgi:predicted CopG family antitoxin
MNKTIYIKDEALWHTAKHRAHAQGRSFSDFIERALRRAVDADRPTQPSDPELGHS